MAGLARGGVPPGHDGTPGFAGRKGNRGQADNWGGDYMPWNTSDDSKTAGSFPWLIQ